MFTANINADMGMKANFELGVRLTENQRLQAVEKIKEIENNNCHQNKFM